MGDLGWARLAHWDSRFQIVPRVLILGPAEGHMLPWAWSSYSRSQHTQASQGREREGRLRVGRPTLPHLRHFADPLRTLSELTLLVEILGTCGEYSGFPKRHFMPLKIFLGCHRRPEQYLLGSKARRKETNIYSAPITGQA